MAQNENIQSETSQDEMLAGILQKLSGAQTPSSNVNSGGTGGGDLFSSLLSNPELLSKLPTIISTVKPILEMLGSGGGGAIPASAPQSPVTALSAQSTASPLQKGNPSADSRAALLCAMKPYLSRDRQNAIDYIVKLSRLGDILKTL